ncbi:hypothetical protein SLEP1_g34714 [Rubroshorea leprosula]|uniref:Uncharacterized protein n=1 Tax=Rubroshorea leprosula TaxID=152421 RepID=A0AAV5KKW2_9ROSI|nr:hypothetical protein SLEP1_g34714 [Rubroshorea leprosula]
MLPTRDWIKWQAACSSLSKVSSSKPCVRNSFRWETHPPFWCATAGRVRNSRGKASDTGRETKKTIMIC